MAVNFKLLKQQGFMRQKQKNKFSVRIRVVGGKLTATQLAGIADIAETFGNGTVHLTSRQSVEIPFVKLEELEQFRQALAEHHLETANCGAGVRTVTACQGNAVCGSGCIDTYGLAKELEERYFTRKLPHKFKIGITGCQNNCLKAEENDLGIKGAIRPAWRESDCIHCGLCEKACRHQALVMDGDQIRIHPELCTFCGRCVHACPVDAWDAQEGYLVTFGGLFGNTIRKGEAVTGLITDKQELLHVCDTAIAYFEELANAGERFSFTLDRTGWEQFRETIQAN